MQSVGLGETGIPIRAGVVLRFRAEYQIRGHRGQVRDGFQIVLLGKRRRDGNGVGVTLRSRLSGAASWWTPAWSRCGAMQRGCGSLASRRKRGIRVMALLSQ